MPVAIDSLLFVYRPIIAGDKHEVSDSEYVQCFSVYKCQMQTLLSPSCMYILLEVDECRVINFNVPSQAAR